MGISFLQEKQLIGNQIYVIERLIYQVMGLIIVVEGAKVADWKKSIPMGLTYLRIVLAVTLFTALFEGIPHRFLITMCFFILGALTDWLDGYWARVHSCESNFGKFMDLVADKIFMLAAFLCLLELGAIEMVMVFVIVSRDLLVGAIRSQLASHNVILGAGWIGKLKTCVQMFAVPSIFWSRHSGQTLFETAGYWVLWFAVILSLLSAIQYFSHYTANRRADKFD